MLLAWARSPVPRAPRRREASVFVARAIVGDRVCHGEVLADRFHPIAGDIFGSHTRAAESLPLADVTLRPPVENSRIICVIAGFLPPGLTTRTAEMTPRWIPKAPNFVTGDGGEIPYPTHLKGVLWMEAELAVVIGATLRRASPDDARDAIFGWTVFNDVTAPEFGETGDWSTGKSLDGFGSMGPWIRTDLDEERVMAGLSISTLIKGNPVQSGSTARFRFAPSEVISDVSHRITLFPGDVISLGTPPPAPTATVGDHVELDIEEVGQLTNFVVASE